MTRFLIDPWWIQALWLGAGATAVFDAWTALRRAVFGVPLPDYALVGRWIAHMRGGRFVQPSIAAAAPVRGERALGWCVHYGIGIAFAGVLLAIVGPAWLRAPTLAPALATGIATVAAPFLLLQPGMGAGVAARRTPHPWRARLHSLVGHAVFGVGLYLAALVARAVLFP